VLLLHPSEPSSLPEDSPAIQTFYPKAKMLLSAIHNVQRRHQQNSTAVETPTIATTTTGVTSVSTRSTASTAEQIMTWIEDGTVPWSSLGSDLQNNPDFAQGLTHFPNINVAQDFFARFPALARDLRFWERLLNRHQTSSRSCSSQSPQLLYDLIDRFAPQDFIDDHDLMVQACLLNWRVLDLAASRSRLGEAFWTDLLGRDPPLLRHMPRSAQLRFPHVVRQALQPLGAASHPDMLSWDVAVMVAERIAPSLWRRGGLLLQWFQAGLPFVGSVFGPNLLRLQNDGQVFLLVAKHCCCASFRRRSFGFASTSLCADKDFMLQAVALDARLFAYASRELKNDLDLALLFLSSDLETVETYFGPQCSMEQKQYIHNVHTYVLQRLHLYNTFVSTVLCGFVETDSAFSMLNQGTETATMYKKNLVHAINVPCGSELLRLRRALTNLTKLMDKAQ